MSAFETNQHLQHSKPLLVDVREPWEFEICHIDNSINIPMGQIAQHLERLRNAQECVVICHHGLRSMNVIQYLLQQDIDHVVNLDGGIDAWAREIDLNMPLY